MRIVLIGGKPACCEEIDKLLFGKIALPLYGFILIGKLEGILALPDAILIARLNAALAIPISRLMVAPEASSDERFFCYSTMSSIVMSPSWNTRKEWKTYIKFLNVLFRCSSRYVL